MRQHRSWILSTIDPFIYMDRAGNVIRLFKPSGAGKNAAPSTLGHLENDVLKVLWARGESNVHQVAESLERSLAYTTVMTTLDRLYKKGLLKRQKIGRAFSYSPKLSRREWEQKQASDYLAAYLCGTLSGESLVSCFVDAVGRQDQSLLDELEKKIRLRREYLSEEKP